jgi:hypothetical protein
LSWTEKTTIKIHTAELKKKHARKKAWTPKKAKPARLQGISGKGFGRKRTHISKTQKHKTQQRGISCTGQWKPEGAAAPQTKRQN